MDFEITFIPVKEMVVQKTRNFENCTVKSSLMSSSFVIVNCNKIFSFDSSNMLIVSNNIAARKVNTKYPYLKNLEFANNLIQKTSKRKKTLVMCLFEFTCFFCFPW